MKKVVSSLIKVSAKNIVDATDVNNKIVSGEASLTDGAVIHDIDLSSKAPNLLRFTYREGSYRLFV